MSEAIRKRVVDTSTPRKPSLSLPEKRPLVPELPPAVAFDATALGPALEPAVMAIKQIIGAPEALCGACILGAATLAAQPHADVAVDNREFPLSNNLLTVAVSGERKTSCDKLALAPHRLFEEKISARRQAALDKFKIAQEAYAGTRAAIMKKPGSPDDKARACQQLGPEPVPPLETNLTCEEPTIEGLIRSLAAGWPSQGIFSDEGGRFLNGYAMSNESKVSSFATLSKMWDGSPIDRVRLIDGASKIRGRRLSVHLMAQPAVVGALLNDPGAIGQGFLSRCLVNWPESTIGTRDYRTPTPESMRALEKYRDAMLALLEMPLPVVNPSDPRARSQLSPRKLRLSAEAHDLYVSFYNRVEIELGRQSEHLRAFSNKAPEQLLRLAGVLQIVDDPASAEISRVNAERAEHLADYFLEQAARVCEGPHKDQKIVLAMLLLTYFKQVGAPVCLAQIYQRGPKLLRNADEAKLALEVLEEHGQIERVSGVTYGGRKQAVAWSVVAE